MLKKLFIHEWKDTWKLMAIVNASVLLYALVGMIVFNQKTVEQFFSSSKAPGAATMIGFFSYFMVYAVGIGVLGVMSILYFFIRFYRHLYTDQGYLMHTLPVKTSDLLVSKTLVAMLWRGISLLVCFLAVAMLLTSMGGKEMWEDLFKDLENLHLSSGKAILLVILLVVCVIGSIAFGVAKGYAAISIGQQMGKNKVLSSIGIYIGLNVLINLITNIVTQSVSFGIIGLGEDSFLKYWEPTENTFLIIYLIVDLVILAASAGLFILSHHFMKNKLNLE